MAKITKVDRNKRDTVVVKTKSSASATARAWNWWKARSKADLAQQVIQTAAYLKDNQQYRFRQASIHARMYGNLPLANFAGSSFNKLAINNNLPADRPTMNVIQSCIDTLVSRISQARPKPMFLTDGGDYKARTLAKQMNQFIWGEFHQTKAYELAPKALRDAAILGDGCVKVLETNDGKVSVERTLVTELYVDTNDAFYGAPRCMYQLKLFDREVLQEMMPEYKSEISKAESAYPDSGGDSQKTTADQVMVVEAWRLPSGPGADDGRHVIACSAGVLCDEQYEKDDFPFVFMHYSPRLVGLWSQGLAEQLTGTQIEINKLLVTISQSISLVGVPRVFVEDGSKVVKAHLNNSVGSIVTYRGTKPSYEVAPCVPAELYSQLQRLIEYSYQQSGISALAATSQKPAGLNSGQAIREFDDLQSDRFAVLSKSYDDFFIKLAYKIIDKACDIALRDGKYQTVYPNKDGTKQIDLPEAKQLEDPFVIQCYDSNALPKDPAGRKQSIVEDMQAGIITLEEGRRLLNYPDLEQDDKLAIAAEERILKTLDEIVETGKYTPPDTFTNLELAIVKVNQYYNLYMAHGLEEAKAAKLRDWRDQVIMLQQAAMPPPPPPGMAPADPNLAVPEAAPSNPMIPRS